MNLTESIAKKTDQQNFENYARGPKTVTISAVKAGTAEQPIEIHLVEFPGQPYKPSKSMRRVLVAAWGVESSAYSSRQMTLFGDPSVRFGPDVVGGIKISHLSHIDKPVTTDLTVSKGKRKNYTVKPLTAAVQPNDTSGRNWISELTLAGDDLEAVASLGKAATDAHAAAADIAAIRARYDGLKVGT